MATKQEELKALEQIKKIVEKIGGADSYVGQAFSGCFEIAQDNIENDFWNSMKDQRDTCSKREFELKKELATVKEAAKQAQDIAVDEHKKAVSLAGRVNELDECATKNWNAFREQEDKVETLQQEIIRLKARLFDMMEAQGA